MPITKDQALIDAKAAVLAAQAPMSDGTAKVLPTFKPAGLKAPTTERCIGEDATANTQTYYNADGTISVWFYQKGNDVWVELSRRAAGK